MERRAASEEATSQIPAANLVNYASEDRIDTVSEADRGILFQAKAAFVTRNDSEEVLLAEDGCKEVFIAENDFSQDCPKDGFVTLSDGTSTALDNTVVTFSYSALEAESSKAISDGSAKSSKVTSDTVTKTSKATSDNTEIAQASSGGLTTETSKANAETSELTSDANAETAIATSDTGTETQADTANTVAESDFFQYPSINDASSGKIGCSMCWVH